MSNAVALGWPSGTDTGWPSEPRNMLPGRIEGYPQGSQRSANTAERLLSQAVGWWDAAAYRDGDRLLRNRGVAGELLDLQLGSSDRVATTNDPLFLAPEDQGYVYLPGVGANALTVPDENALDITGDIDIRVKVAMDDWTPGALTGFVAKWIASTSQSFGFDINTNGTLAWFWSETGTTLLTVNSSVAPTIADGSTLWVRVTHDVDNGASGNDVKFFTSDDGVTWTQLGVTRTQAGVTSIFAGTSSVFIGATTASFSGPLPGKMYRAIIKDGIDGTTVLDVDCDAITDGSATSFQAVTGQTVTINRSTSGRKSVAVPSRSLKKWDDPHVYLPGVANNFLSVPDENALDITGDIDLQAQVALNNWIPNSEIGLVGKYGSSGNRGYRLGIASTGVLVLRISSDGTDQQIRFSTVITGLSAGSTKWVRATFDADNGASGNDIQFFLSDDGITWTQLGATVTTANATSIFNNSANVQIGGTPEMAGKVYRAVIYSDLTETTKVLDVDCAKAPTNFIAGNNPTFLADTGQTVTLNSTAGSGMEVRGERFSSGRSLFLLGTDDFFDSVVSRQQSSFENRLLTIDKEGPITIFYVVRSFDTSIFVTRGSTTGTPTPASGTILSAAVVSSTLEPNYYLRVPTPVPTVGPRFPIGSLGCITNTLITDGSSELKRVWTNAIPGAVNSTVSGKVELNEPFRIGASRNLVAGHFEFTAAAIFKRILTPDEIKTITDYYQNRGY